MSYIKNVSVNFVNHYRSKSYQAVHKNYDWGVVYPKIARESPCPSIMDR